MLSFMKELDTIIDMEQSNSEKSGSDIIIIYGVYYHENVEL